VKHPSSIACIIAVVSSPVAAARPAQQDAAVAAADPKTLLGVEPGPAGSASLIPTSARRYAEAKRYLARGKPAQALRALERYDAPLFEDRIALLRGDALLALGDPTKAADAYRAALARAQVKSVAIGAARGLVDALGQLGRHEEQLLYVEALLLEPGMTRRPQLTFQKAEVLTKLGRGAEAVTVFWSIMIDFPTSPLVKAAEKELERAKKRGIDAPVTTTRLELARVKGLARAGSGQAERAMDALVKKAPDLEVEVALIRADMYQRQRRRGEEARTLEALLSKTLTEKTQAMVLSRLGRLAMSRDDDATALAFFDRLRGLHPKDPDSVEGQYLAAWIPYNVGRFEESAERMLEFAETYPKSKRRTEALWFAAWASYLEKKDGRARRVFEQLLEEHPKTILAPNAHYWLGRIRHRANELDLARQEYRKVLEIAPLSYYGFWAAERLAELGEETVLNPPPPESGPVPVKQVIAILGESRPLLIDRAIALHAADLRNEALEELTASAKYLRRIKDTRGRTMVADLLHRLGAHNLAFRVAMVIAYDGGDLVTGEPYAWRAWRHAYPRAFEPEVIEASKAHEVDDDLVLSIMRTESHFRPNVTSPAGAKGLMQLMPGTAKQIGGRADGGKAHAARFESPRSNVWLGTYYLGSLLERYGDNVGLAAGAYNGGPGAMDEWVEKFRGMPYDEFVERVPYRETRRYMRRVVETYFIYLRLAGQPIPKLSAVVAIEPGAKTVDF
jgi:soluble lytic murein transglycosylase